MSDGMGREFAYLSSHATNRYFIPNWGIQWHDEIIPIEVKAENCVSGRSLTVYNEKYNPRRRIRFSFLNLQYNNGLLNCPSPIADWFPKLLKAIEDLAGC